MAKRDQGEDKPKRDVRAEVAATLIAMMEAGTAPWQRPWDVEASSPTNIATGHAYRGVNRWLLAATGRSGFATWAQADKNGWHVRPGEKGTMIVKVIDLGPEKAEEGKAAREEDGDRSKARTALMHYYVFGRDQMISPPPLDARAERDFEPAERARAVLEALVDRTRMTVDYGGNHAFYDQRRHHVQLPMPASFHSRYGMWATALHECAHAAMGPTLGNISATLNERWGPEAYAQEELRAEISAAVMAAETGVAPDPHSPEWRRHLEGHASYLSSWIAAIKSDPLAIFAAARDAEKVSDYLIALALERERMAPHREWVQDFEREPELAGGR